MKRCIAIVVIALSGAVAQDCDAGALDNPECIAAAKPGGGFDMACKLAQALLSEAKVIKDPMRVSYMPGGIGAVAYNVFATKRPGEPNVVVAFSSGSLLNLAQGKFGQYTEKDVRWVATVGADHGAVVVDGNSSIKSLRDLEAALRRDSTKVVFGGGGAVGSQDWMKAALIARAMGVDYKTMRFVAFEGGGEAITALRGGHVQVLTGDVAETLQQMDKGSTIRVIAVLSEKRLSGRLAHVPTAKEQGYDIQWRIVRGFYVGPKVSDADYKLWSEAFRKAMAAPAFPELLAQRGLLPFPLTGSEVEQFVRQTVEEYRGLASQFGLRTVPGKP